MASSTTGLEEVKLDSDTDASKKKSKRTIDPSQYNLVEAAQYGLLDRCRELVEKEGIDVNKGDEENITVLHWAAINNRIPVVSYFLQKGADINAIGGELKSPPIHWATRQGHMSMVVHLMRYGGLAEITDGEGLNCLHIAAQFGLTAIMAYYIACRHPIEIDCRDSEGRTPLMHAAARASTNFETVRLLASLGADLTLRDKQGNSALHHASINLNFVATKVLIDAGAPLDVLNNDGKTAYDLAMENQNTYAMDQITLARQKQNPKGFFELITRKPSVVWWLMLFFPLVLLGLLAGSGVVCPTWWIYWMVTTLITAATKKIAEVYLPVLPNKNPAVFGVVIATKFWLYFTAVVYFIPTGILQHYVWMHLLTLFTVFIFYKVSRSDPGLIPRSSNIHNIYKLMVELCERGEFNGTNFCSTCLVRRPLRSKHCSACDRCVARFDHHCPWVNTCIGLKNHKLFLLYLLCLLIMLTWGARASLTYLFVLFPADHGNFLVKTYHYITCDPWVGFIMIMCFFHLIWVHILLLVQLFQMICQGVTTNELQNRYKYAHFSKSNPFQRGVLANAAEFLGCTCCQSDKDRLDWTNTYALPKKYQKTQPGVEGGASESDERSNVRIPLPFSRTWDPMQDKLEKARKKFKRSGYQSSNGYLSSDDDTCKEQFSANREFNI